MPQKITVNSSVEVNPAEVGGCLSGGALQGLCSERAAVWFDCRTYERAESHYYMRLQERQNGTTSASSTSNSKHVQEKSPKRPDSVTTPRSLRFSPDIPSTPDEGYLSQTPTPRTPASAPINGLPLVPAFLQEVWFQKPLYDRAEATFYQNLYNANKPHSSPNEAQACAERSRTTVTEKPKPDKTKEKKPNGVKKGSSALCHFLHADSERVWLERSRYAEAETRFYEAGTGKTGCSSSLKYDRVYTHTLALKLDICATA